MKKIISFLFILLLFSSSFTHALSPVPIEQVNLGTLQPLQILQNPFTKEYQASIIAQPVRSTALTQNKLDMSFIYTQTYAEGTGMPAEFSIQLITRGNSSFLPKDITVTLAGIHPNTLTLSPKEIIRSTRDNSQQTLIIYSLSKSPLLLKHLQDKSVSQFSLSGTLDDGTVQMQIFPLTNHLKEELKKLTSLDLSQEGTFQLTKPQ